MNFSLRKLLFWYSLYFLLFAVQPDLIDGFNVRKAFDFLVDYNQSILFLSGALSFFLYVVSAYSVLFYSYGRTKNFWVGLMIICCVFLAIPLRYVIQEILQKALFGFGNYYKISSAKYYILDNLYYAIIFTSFGIIYFFIRYSKHISLQQHQLLVEKKQAELSMLRAQINPHFLFNSLNNIYSLISTGTANALIAVERLTNVLRYVTYEKEDKVQLTKELEVIGHFVELQKLRYAYPIKFISDIHIEPECFKIAPLVLLPLVENAFKHGALKTAGSGIVLKIWEDPDDVVFLVQNRIGQQEKDRTGGVGLENVRSRLQLIYGIEHQFKVQKEGDIFTVTLKIRKALC